MKSNEEGLRANTSGARQSARKLLKDTGIRTIPVSLADIIRHLQTKHQLDVLQASFSDSVSGILVIDGEFATIGFNENHPWCRRRFTIAHEIGHFLMGHLCEGESNDAEQEANAFAAELLMPGTHIKKEPSHDLDALSKKYRVSREALCRQLIYCRVL